jgi:hypothetical protein
MTEEEKHVSKTRVKLKGKVSSRAVCFVCDEEILQIGRSWLHANLATHDHEAHPASRAEISSEKSEPSED